MSDFTDFVDDYYRRFVEVLQTFDRAPMRGALEVLERVQASGGTIWVAGNGGSAAIADHTVCDATKGTYVDGQPPLRTVSLSSNAAMLTALSNDFCYTDAYWKAARLLPAAQRRCSAGELERQLAERRGGLPLQCTRTESGSPK